MATISSLIHNDKRSVTVVGTTDNYHIPVKISLEFPSGDDFFKDKHMFAMSAQISEVMNLQFTPTVGSDLYVYLLGKSEAVVELTGLCWGGCEDSEKHGSLELIEQFNEWESNQVLQGPCKLLYGDKIFKIYLQSYKLTADAGTTNDLYKFTLQLRGLRE